MKNLIVLFALISLSLCSPKQTNESQVEVTSEDARVMFGDSCYIEKVFLTRYGVDNAPEFYEFEVIDGKLKGFTITGDKKEEDEYGEVYNCDSFSFFGFNSVSFKMIEGIPYLVTEFYSASSFGSRDYYPAAGSGGRSWSEDEAGEEVE